MSGFNRRDFAKLSLAALGGMVAGSGAACNRTPPPAPAPAAGTTPATPGGATPAGVEVAAAEAHVCRGLNTCAGKGAGPEKNACAGQGACATTAAHDCAGQNACKGQGGCGGKIGSNECKSHGGCAVPLTGEMWKTAREEFEKKMQDAGKEFGAAPPAAT